MEKQPIRILQRPCPSSTNQSSDSSRPPTVIKSLEQKEADYAAARRRIMGSDISEVQADEQEVTKGSIQHVANVSGLNGASAVRQSLTSQSNGTFATPLMSIPATPVTTNGLNSDFGLSGPTTGVQNAGVHNRASFNARQGLAVVNVAQKLQQQPGLNGTRPVLQAHQPQQRILSASASSPSFFPITSRTTQPLPLFPSQQPGTTNAGLLPTPPGFNYSMQNANLNGTGGNGLNHSHSAAFALMHQISLLQQQYPHTLNGFQNQLVPPAVPHTNASFNHLNFTSVHSQSNINPKHAHPPAFN